MSLKKKIILFAVLAILIIAIIVGVVVKININNTSKESKEVETIQDTTPPIIVLDDFYVVKVGYDKDLLSVIMSADDIDPNPKREIIGEYDVNQEGEYNLTYKIEDASGNVTTKDFTLKVRENSSYTENDINFKDAIANYKTENTKLGIDVSKWQQEINWEDVAKDGAQFAIIRMGYQNGFDGDVLEDPYFVKNIEGCKTNNIPVSVYFSSYAKSVEESKSHAEWICKYLKDKGYDDLSISFDWENWTSFNKLGISLNDINNIADAFMQECENLGHKAMLYGSKTYLEAVWKNPNNYPVWLANYVDKTSYEGKYKLWQICQTGRINGISGYVDINVEYNN